MASEDVTGEAGGLVESEVPEGTLEDVDVLVRCAVRNFWTALEAWQAGRMLAGQLPGGPQVFGTRMVATFQEEMKTRGRDEDWIRGALGQIAKIGIEWLAPGTSDSFDLSGVSCTPGDLAPYMPPAGEGPAGPTGLGWPRGARAR